jgi:hypothetical protein
MLRQAVMCQGDASLMTMKWGTTDPVPLANSNSLHQCINWSALDAWAKSRHVNVYEPGLVVHPTLGESVYSFQITALWGPLRDGWNLTQCRYRCGIRTP